ncbi:MAG: LysE family translocator [Aeromonadaceae bacterium]
MTNEWILPLAGFAWVTCITPGPNNLMLTASGARFGFRRTLPHVLGISAGMGVMLLIVASGLGQLFLHWPLLQTLLKVAGSAYLIWLGWMIATAPPTVAESEPVSQEHAVKPFRFYQAVLFQFVNPKAWLMSISAIGSFTLLGNHYWGSVFLLVLLFCLICTKTCLLWAQFGVQMGRWLRSPRAWLWFNRTMGLLTAACVVVIWY